MLKKPETWGVVRHDAFYYLKYQLQFCQGDPPRSQMIQMSMETQDALYAIELAIHGGYPAFSGTPKWTIHPE